MTRECRDVETFVEQLPVGIIVLGPDLQVSTSNDLALQLLGIGIENCLAGNFLDAVADTRLKESLRSVHEGRSQQCRVMIESVDKVVSCTLKTLRGKSDCLEIVIVVEDATQMRGLEQLKREFIGTLLHRIRGPLATLKTSLALVLYESLGSLSGEAREIISMGHHEVNRLSVLLNDLRDLFLIETGLAGKDLVPETFSMADVSQERADDRPRKLKCSRTISGSGSNSRGSSILRPPPISKRQSGSFRTSLKTDCGTSGDDRPSS